jgi:hypothetical protein
LLSDLLGGYNEGEVVLFWSLIRMFGGNSICVEISIREKIVIKQVVIK